MDADTGSLILFLVFLFLGATMVLIQTSIEEVFDPYGNLPDDPQLSNRDALEKLSRNPDFSSVMRTAYTTCHLCAAVFLIRFFFALGVFPRTTAGQGLEAAAAVAMSSLCILIFSRGLPRKIADAKGKVLGCRLAPAGLFISRLLSPFQFLINLAVNLLCRLLGIPVSRPEEVTEDDIRTMVAASASDEQGGIEETEKEMIDNVFEFDDRTVSDIMTHRTDIVSCSLDDPLDKVISLSSEYGYSRIPVIGEDADDVLGILNVKDLLPLLSHPEQSASFSVGQYLRQPLFVPESTRCSDLFRKFKQEKAQIAIVVDEYGGVSGLVTMEDLIESIVGNIQDEYDHESEEARELAPDQFTFEGNVDLEEAARLLDCDFSAWQDQEFETLGGLLIGILDRIPQPGEHPSIRIGNIIFTVEDSTPRQILRISAVRRHPLSPMNPGQDTPSDKKSGHPEPESGKEPPPAEILEPEEPIQPVS